MSFGRAEPETLEPKPLKTKLQNATLEIGPFRSHKPAQDLEAWETSAVEP